MNSYNMTFHSIQSQLGLDGYREGPLDHAYPTGANDEGTGEVKLSRSCLRAISVNTLVRHAAEPQHTKQQTRV